MLKSVPEEFHDLLEDKAKAFAYLATVMKDGSPQVSPVWFGVDGENILVNTARGRVKDKNMGARPDVALTISDPKDPYRYLLIRGRVVGSTEENAYEHINHMSHIYKHEDFPKRQGQVRVIYKILPEKVFGNRS